MASPKYIPLKYKFSAALLGIVLSACSVFFFSVYRTTYQDKQLFIRDLSLATLDAALSAITFEFKTRMDDMQSVIRKIYESRVSVASDPRAQVFANLSSSLQNEILGVSFYQPNADKTFTLAHRYTNDKLLKQEGLPSTLLTDIENRYPPLQEPAFRQEELTLLNRSVQIGNDLRPYPVVTFLFQVIFADQKVERNVVAVDLSQDFLRRILKRSEVSDLFLVTRDGKLLSHSNLETTVQFSAQAFAHPIVHRLGQETQSSESLELDWDNETYLFNLANTGFKDLYIVSQTAKDQVFLALQTLVNQSLLLATAVIWVVILLGILFAGRLTVNIKKLKEAAEQVGQGNLNVKLNIRSNDELRDVSNSFKWMTKRINELITESMQKGRMEHELQTAKLVQTTLLAPPQLQAPSMELASHYSPMTECGGDFWDGWIRDNKLTLLVADATGHGASAAIATAVAKASVETLNAFFKEKAHSCSETIAAFNSIMYASCKGSVLMTMSLFQLDLTTGEVSLCSAGHEAPLRLPALSGKPQRKQKEGEAPFRPEFLIARGERLGYSPDSQYQEVKYQLEPGDTILLYTDGITEAPNKDGKEWGERSLKKHLSEGFKQPLSAVCSAIAQGVQSHIQGVGQNDDITFVLLRWTPRSLAKAA